MDVSIVCLYATAEAVDGTCLMQPRSTQIGPCAAPRQTPMYTPCHVHTMCTPCAHHVHTMCTPCAHPIRDGEDRRSKRCRDRHTEPHRSRIDRGETHPAEAAGLWKWEMYLFVEDPTLPPWLLSFKRNRSSGERGGLPLSQNGHRATTIRNTSKRVQHGESSRSPPTPINR